MKQKKKCHFNIRNMKIPFLSIDSKNVLSIRYFVNLQLSYRASLSVDFRLVPKMKT